MALPAGISGAFKALRPNAPPKKNRAEDRSALFDDRFLKTLEYLHMVSRKVFAGNLRAERRTRKVGSGIEFADHRTYSRGDDFRYIDWNLYGRLDKLLLRLFEEEEDLYIYILVDVSDSMSIGSPLPKLHYAMQVGAALSYVGLANLDRVSIIPFGDKVVGRLAPTRGKNRIFRVFEFLRTCEIGGKTELAECMKDFVAQNKRRGVVLVVSDLYDPKSFETGIDALRYGRFEPRILHLVDRRDAEPDLHGDVVLVDRETGEQREVTVTDAVLRRFREAHERHGKRIQAFAGDKHVPLVRLDVSERWDDAVLGLLRRGGILS